MKKWIIVLGFFTALFAMNCNNKVNVTDDVVLTDVTDVTTQIDVSNDVTPTDVQKVD